MVSSGLVRIVLSTTTESHSDHIAFGLIGPCVNYLTPTTCNCSKWLRARLILSKSNSSPSPTSYVSKYIMSNWKELIQTSCTPLPPTGQSIYQTMTTNNCPIHNPRHTQRSSLSTTAKTQRNDMINGARCITIMKTYSFWTEHALNKRRGIWSDSYQ